jgi:hypothetical protein
VTNRHLGALMWSALLLVGCADRTGAAPASPSSQPTTSERGATVELRGILVKYTNFRVIEAIHMSEVNGWSSAGATVANHDRYR